MDRSEGMDCEAHGGMAVDPDEDTALLEDSSSREEEVSAFTNSYFVSTTLWLLALAGCMAIFSVVSYGGRYGTRLFEEKPPREIMLFGDSLVGVSESKYRIGEDIAKELENKHSEYEVYVSTSGENGNCAKDLLKRVDK